MPWLSPMTTLMPYLFSTTKEVPSKLIFNRSGGGSHQEARGCGWEDFWGGCKLRILLTSPLRLEQVGGDCSSTRLIELGFIESRVTKLSWQTTHSFLLLNDPWEQPKTDLNPPKFWKKKKSLVCVYIKNLQFAQKYVILAPSSKKKNYELAHEIQNKNSLSLLPCCVKNNYNNLLIIKKIIIKHKSGLKKPNCPKNNMNYL